MNTLGDYGADDDDDDAVPDDDQKGYDDDEIEYKDYIGDIEAKLKANKLEYKMLAVGDSVVRSKMFREGYRGLMEATVGTDGTDADFLQHQRIISLVDRRDTSHPPKLTETTFVYKTSDSSKGGNPRDIPKDAVPEWYMASSAMSVLPDMHYGDDHFERKVAETDYDVGTGMTLTLKALCFIQFTVVQSIRER